MKKTILIASIAIFFGLFLTSCGSHGKCAGITTQVGKVKVSNTPSPL